MRQWGIVISVFYALVVLGLLAPSTLMLSLHEGVQSQIFMATFGEALGTWWVWLPVAVVLLGQILLLFLSVDTAQKRLKPRAHLAVSVAVAAMLFALLAFAALGSLGSAIYADKFIDRYLSTALQALGYGLVLWLIWAVVFYLYLRHSTAIVTRLVSWLLKGSVLELLIAVPCHVVVRRRGDCCAPLLTGMGITAGIAVMLLSFGPSVLFLYKNRMDAYATRKAK